MLAIQIKKIKLWTFLVLTIPLISLSISSQDRDLDIPSIGDRVSGVVSLEQEKAIGSQFLKQVYAGAPIINDPLIQEYTELLIYKISETSLVKDRDFKLVLIDDRSLNAFAAPGGIIGVNAGLFIHADNEGQFASVIAHELAHLSQRHFARQILEGSDRSNQSLATVLASILVAVATNSPAAVIGGQGILACLLYTSPSPRDDR